MYKLLILFLFVSIITYSQPSIITTDRPDQTDSPFLVPTGQFQLETGLNYISVSKKVSAFNFASSLLRYGLNEDIELRAGTQFTSVSYEFNGEDDSESGLNGILLSSKFKLNVLKEHIPNLALIADLLLPIGNDEIVGDDVEPGVYLTALNPLSDKLGLGWNVGFFLVNGNDVSLKYSASLGILLDEKLSGFVELFGDITTDVDDGFMFNAGITYLLSNDLQLDSSFGIGFTDGSPDFFISGGVSYRFPK